MTTFLVAATADLLTLLAIRLVGEALARIQIAHHLPRQRKPRGTR